MGGLSDALFVILSGSVIFLSLSLVAMRYPVRATFVLFFSFILSSVIYIFLYAPFVGVLQILVYSGAILVLFTFVVMMINPAPFMSEEEARREKAAGPQKATMAVIAVLASLLLLIFVNATVGAYEDELAGKSPANRPAPEAIEPPDMPVIDASGNATAATDNSADAAPTIVAMSGEKPAGSSERPEDFGSIQSIGRLLFADPLNSPFFLAIQLMAFLILSGIIAAVNLARGPQKIETE